MNFSDLGLVDFLVSSLTAQNIVSPTEIQAKSIPAALEGSDILACSETGSGKTLSYLLPVVHNLYNSKQGIAIVLAPTRELAVQVKQAVDVLLHRSGAFAGSSALLIGGQSMFAQQQALRRSPKMIIGTPGRVNDHLERGTLDLSKANYLVLDEFDRMLDIGFFQAIDRIISFMPKGRQTFMFSATFSPEVEKLSQKYLVKPVKIAVQSKSVVCANIRQETVQTSGSDKFSCLMEELNNREGAVIVFSKTKAGAERLSEKLRDRNFKALALHGNLRQNRRDQVVRAFREMKSRILVATDIAARGLDISHVRHVVNYDLPQCPEDYVHRLGRTGRAGNEGFAVSFITPEESLKWKRICRLVGINNLPQARKFFASKVNQQVSSSSSR